MAISLGTIGRTTTALVPYGKMTLHGQTYEAKSEHGVIDADRNVIIIKADAFGLVVRLHDGPVSIQADSTVSDPKPKSTSTSKVEPQEPATEWSLATGFICMVAMIPLLYFQPQERSAWDILAIPIAGVGCGLLARWLYWMRKSVVWVVLSLTGLMLGVTIGFHYYGVLHGVIMGLCSAYIAPLVIFVLGIFIQEFSH